MDENNQSLPEDENYEFSNEQNEMITLLSSKMNSVGIYFYAVGIISGVFAILNLFSKQTLNFIYPIIQAAIFLIIGNLTKSAATSFKMIVVTKGSDIKHLMTAITTLSKFFKLIFSIVIVASVLLITVLVIYFITGSLLHKI